MKYMGSKARIAKYILPIILKDRKEGQWYVEPFVGGANMIDKVDGNRIGADSNEYLIALFDAVSRGWLPPEIITEEKYIHVKGDINKDKALSGYVGFSMSFGGKWFGGYRRDIAGTADNSELKRSNEITQSRRSFTDISNQAKNIQGVHFFHKSYNEFMFTKPCIIYCDPPYANTTKYKSGGFDHDEFWQWCRDKSKEGHQVFISEYNAPDDFKCIWQKEIVSSLTKDTGSKTAIEKLFIYAPN
jgi:DNA adenine methylase